MAVRMVMLSVALFTGFCVLVCAGCVSFMQNWNPWATREPQKSESATRHATPPASPEEKTLTRPKIPDATLPDEVEKARSSVKVSSKKFEGDAAVQGDKKGESKESKTVRAEDNPGKDAASSPAEETNPAAKSGKTGDPTAKTEPTDPVVEGEETGEKKHAFKKHDHMAYVDHIKDKAYDLIKKKPDCTLVRLCRHNITDEWTLQLYVRKTKSFSFTLYSWDEIDDKWEKSYESGDRPATQWEHHLRFSSASKECSDLSRK